MRVAERTGARKWIWLSEWGGVFLGLLALLAAVVYRADPGETPEDLADYPWLYLRQGQPLGSDERLVELVAVGDIMLGRGVAGEPDPFRYVSPWLRSADLALGNFEGAIAAAELEPPAPQKTSSDQPLILEAPPGAADILEQAGFDLLSLANNHAFDLGPAGLQRTVDRLRASGIRSLGEAGAVLQPIYIQVKGLRLAFLALNAVPQPSGSGMPVSDAQQAQAALRAARAQADVVIVSVHWGYEYRLQPDPAQRQMAADLLAAGADLVVGHHPHVVQGTQVVPERQNASRREQFVAYSLGNFVFDQYEDETGRGLALRVFFDQHGLRGVQALPVYAGAQPRLMLVDQAKALLERVAPPAHRLGFACDKGSCYPIDVPQEETRHGLFRTGEIDLTGDGAPERIVRTGKAVAIYQDGLLAWQSPVEWQVVDLALGDPNDDGRAELLLALQKPDASGVSRSHPFIVGYRSGSYRLLWGGSPVNDPIQEVELGDVDGDGVQELVVLDEMDGGRALSIWRWHGWGFSLSWRSPPSPYEDLVLLPSEDGQCSLISLSSQW